MHNVCVQADPASRKSSALILRRKLFKTHRCPKPPAPSIREAPPLARSGARASDVEAASRSSCEKVCEIQRVTSLLPRARKLVLQPQQLRWLIFGRNSAAELSENLCDCVGAFRTSFGESVDVRCLLLRAMIHPQKHIPHSVIALAGLTGGSVVRVHNRNRLVALSKNYERARRVKADPDSSLFYSVRAAGKLACGSDDRIPNSLAHRAPDQL
mmetsp:Transcript_12538/g.33795  ORF Transcript_12538/g.33795 Transcript_12538/m.33795 type:complete len:213 (+) Transcript_12538:289-927(+)